MSAIQFTSADRDEKGFIKAPAEPRSLAELLPTVAPAVRPKAAWHEAAAILVVAIVAVLALIYPRPDAPPVARLATPAAIAAAPTVAPLPTPAAPLLTAYAAPGVPLGPIESTRHITPVAHFGADWIHADVYGSGRLWLRAADFPDLAIVGPDLAPRPTERAVVAPVAPPAAPQCAEAGIAGKMVKVCGLDSLATLEERAKAAWLVQYGGTQGSGDMRPTAQPLRSIP